MGKEHSQTAQQNLTKLQKLEDWTENQNQVFNSSKTKEKTK